MIAERLSAVAGLGEHFELMTGDQVQEFVAFWLRIVLETRPGLDLIDKLDVSFAEDRHVRSWLTSFGVKEMVNVVWMRQREGVRLPYDVLVSHFDDLWYPSSDDVWSASDRQDWLLELDHEEVFRFFRYRASKNE